MPDWERIVQDRIALLHLAPEAEADLTEELTQHLADRYGELSMSGASEDEALQRTVAELDDIPSLRMKSRRVRRAPRVDFVQVGDSTRGSLGADLWRDLRYAGRTMRKNPLFVLFVVVTLALAIGANTTVFTVINTLLLNPLPVPRSSELVGINGAKLGSSAKSSVPLLLSYPDFKDMRSGTSVFSSLAAYSSPRGVTWQSDRSSQGLFVELVTGNYFPTLGIGAAKGRFFLPDEDGTPGAHPVAVLNYGTWQTQFGGNPDIIGKTLRLNNAVVTIIGVAPPHFIGVNAVFGPDLWLPTAMAEALFPNDMSNVFTDRSKTLFQGIGRLRPQVQESQAQANLAGVGANLAREYPGTDEGRTLTLQPIRDVMAANIHTGSGTMLFASLGLMMVVGVVLLIACSNVANLLLARAAGRHQEMAIRLAIGANRSRLLRQLLTESVLLGLLSGIAGLFVAYAGLHLLFTSLPSSANFIAPKFDGVVFAFALAVSLLTGLLFGTLPALRTSKVNLAETLKEEGRTMGKSRKKVTVANGLLVAQVAFSFLLLAVASLFLRSIGHAYAIDPGFQTAHLAVFMTSPGQAGYDRPRTKAFYKDIRERVSRMPEVEHVSWASNLPLWSRAVMLADIEGRRRKSRADTATAIVNTIDRNYFETAGVAMSSGREFTDLDQEHSAAVAIVNNKLAQDNWPGQSAIGKRITLSEEKQSREVIGVAKNANYTSWGEQPQPCVYVPLEQKYSDGMVLYVRTKGSPDQTLTAIQREIRTAGPQVNLSVRTGREIISGGLFFPRVGVVLLGVFGVLALTLASIGLYGILAYAVSQRKREIGLRMALGADRVKVLALIVEEGMSLVGTGIAIGVLASVVIGRLLSRSLYGVSGSDPLSIGGAAIVLLLVALLACYLPARSASRVDPLLALREG